MARFVRVLLISTACMASFDSLAMADRVPLGCFSRTYDTAHLQSHERQQVRRLWLRIEKSQYDPGEIAFGMNLWIRGNKQRWRAGGRCEASDKGLRCQPDTDGASDLLITFEGGNLRLTNPGQLKIFDDVTGPDLNDRQIGGPGDSVYLLRAAPDIVCKDSGPS